ncbi:hypothetical protein FE72_15455 [Staphylococcus aureus]|nr:hypothetical protein FE72_15455 [Staphylococcus aureus]
MRIGTIQYVDGVKEPDGRRIQLDNLFRGLFIFILFRAKDAIGLAQEQIAPAIMPFKVQELWNRQLSFQT